MRLNIGIPSRKYAFRLGYHPLDGRILPLEDAYPPGYSPDTPLEDAYPPGYSRDTPPRKRISTPPKRIFTHRSTPPKRIFAHKYHILPSLYVP